MLHRDISRYNNIIIALHADLTTLVVLVFCSYYVLVITWGRVPHLGYILPQCGTREAHALIDLLYEGWPYIYHFLYKLLQHLGE